MPRLQIDTISTSASPRIGLLALRSALSALAPAALFPLLLSGGVSWAHADSTRTAEEAPSVETWEPAKLELRPLREDGPRARRQTAFGVGEEIHYEVRFGVVNAGSAVMAVDGITERDGRAVYELRSHAESNKVFSLVHRVDDHVRSWMDVQLLRSLGFEKRVQEGDYRKEEDVRFDYGTQQATYDDGKQIEIGTHVQDMLSAVYYLRTLNIEVGRPLTIDAHDGGKNYPLEIRVYGEERISTPAGEFDCLLVEPVMQSEGLFRRQGRLFIWITKDERKIPVRMRSKIVVGSVTVEMTEYVPGRPVTLGEEATAGAVRVPVSHEGAASSFSYRD